MQDFSHSSPRARYSSIHGLSSRLVVYHALFENYLASISTS